MTPKIGTKSTHTFTHEHYMGKGLERLGERDREYDVDNDTGRIDERRWMDGHINY